MVLNIKDIKFQTTFRWNDGDNFISTTKDGLLRLEVPMMHFSIDMQLDEAESMLKALQACLSNLKKKG